MTASAATEKHDFLSLLAAPGRSPEIPEENDAYGWLIGSWDLEVLHYAAVDVAPLHIHGEVHFGWVLEGRAIQDVWIMPRVSERNANLARPGAGLRSAFFRFPGIRSRTASRGSAWSLESCCFPGSFAASRSGAPTWCRPPGHS